MDQRDGTAISQLEMLGLAFREQLLACLEECARGREGLFSDHESLNSAEDETAWPEAARLRELAFALQGAFSQCNEQNALCDEFLDLCTIHGESDPGERRLARAFLERIEKGDVASGQSGLGGPLMKQ